MATYTTITDLRGHLGVSSAVLSDAAATELIEQSEDVIDALLGVRPVSITTGRRVVQSEVLAWQWTKIKRATLLLAARIYSQPDLLDRQWHSISGPDFSFSGPIGSVLGQTVLAPLIASGLAVNTTRVGGRDDNRAWQGNS